MKYKLINFDWIGNNLIVHNLLVNYLNLNKSQYRSSNSPLFCSYFKNSEAALVRCSSKSVFLKILQYSEENIYVGVSF